MDTQESGADEVGIETGGGLSCAGGHHRNDEQPPVQLQWEDLPTNIWGPNRTDGDMCLSKSGDELLGHCLDEEDGDEQCGGGLGLEVDGRSWAA